MKATVIREPYISYLLRGAKTWEMRSRPTAIRGQIGLVKKGSGLVVATAQLVDCLPKLDAREYARTETYHCVTPDEQPNAIAAGWVYPWVLEDIRPLFPPVPYRHIGGVSWVNLDEAATLAIRDQEEVGKDAEPSRAENGKVGPDMKGERTPVSRPRVVGRIDGDFAYVPITLGNITHNHFYLRTILSFFPEGSIGGSDKSQLAKQLLTICYVPGNMVRTDIAGPNQRNREARSAHYFFRDRAGMKDFFARSTAQEGDTVVVCREGPNSFKITLDKRVTELDRS
jgi:hypothetical protein